MEKYENDKNDFLQTQRRVRIKRGTGMRKRNAEPEYGTGMRNRN